MNAPRRIIDGGGSEIARSLIESASEEVPSRESVARALVAVTAGTAVTATAASAGAATAAKGVAAGKASSALGAPVVALLKWLGIGATGAALSVATVGVLETRNAQEENGATAAITRAAQVPGPGIPAVGASARAPLDPELEQPEAPAAAQPAAVPSSSRPLASPAPLAASAAPSPVLDEGVYAEVSTLDQARRSIASGDNESALRTLREYEQRFPNGQLGPEGLAMRMEAQQAAGDHRGAVESARRLIATSPRSPLASRAREIIARGVITSGTDRD